MVNSPDYDLYTKRELKFDKDSKFRILMLSDFQETLDCDERALRAAEGMIGQLNPDLVVFGGDNYVGGSGPDGAELRRYLEIVTESAEKRGIPWAHIYGNHDHDLSCDDKIEESVYESFPHCVSKCSPEEVHGTTNYVLPITASDGSGIGFNLWFLDSNNLAEEFFKDCGLGEYSGRHLLPNRDDAQDVWDVVRFDQLMWYWNTSKKLERISGKKADAMLFIHIAPWEFSAVRQNLSETGGSGSTVERLALGALNSGLFSTILQRGDIKCIASGHTHMDDFEGSYCGVHMCLDACAGFSGYGIDHLRGGRIFEISERNTRDIKTTMLRAHDFL